MPRYYSLRRVISSSSRLRWTSVNTDEMKETNSLCTRCPSESISHSTRLSRANDPARQQDKSCVFMFQ